MCKRAGLATFCILMLLVLPLKVNASAAQTDLEGHWAASEMLRAVEDTYINGYEDGSFAPDRSISYAEALTVLCRVYGVEPSDSESWLTAVQEAATDMKFIRAEEDMTSSFDRLQAFLLLERAFYIADIQEDTTASMSFADALSLSSTELNTVAALVNGAYVTGDNGSLRLDSPVTRAEFVTLLYRVLDKGEVVQSLAETEGLSGDFVWINLAEGEVELSEIEAAKVLLYAHDAEEVSLRRCEIDELVLVSDGDVELSANGADKVRIYASGGTSELHTEHARVILDGESVNFKLYESAETVDVLARNSALYLDGGERFESFTLTGEGNTLTSFGTLDFLRVMGKDSVLDGGGHTKEVYIRAPGAQIPERIQNVTDDTDYGLEGAVLVISAVDVLSAGEMLSVTATVTGLGERELRGSTVTFTVDGAVVQSVGAELYEGAVLEFSYDYTYTRDMAAVSTVAVDVIYETDYGDVSSLIAEHTVTVENHGEEYYAQFEPERVLALVTSDYLGDYTLEWAEQNDYASYEKEIWVDAKGYTSETDYLVWINQSHQRVNIFLKGDDGWDIIRESIVGCGLGMNTPKGVFVTTYNQDGWFMSSYEVRPVVRFYGGGYAFHSRLYMPNSDVLVDDPGIGYPISAGCIRMYDEDIQFMYDYIPSGTTVVVH